MKLSHGEAAQVFRSLALLLHSGVPLADGLFLLAQDAPKKEAALLRSLGEALDQGSSLAQAMTASGAFPAASAAMIHAGQETGRLEPALDQLARYYDSQERTVRQIRQALGYPSVLFALMLAVLSVLLIKVLPVFDSVYASLGSGLTGIAGGLLGLGRLLEEALPVLALLLILGAVMVLFYRYHPGFRSRVNRFFLLRFGDRGIARGFHNVQFTRALAMGLASGLTENAAVELAEGLVSHIPGAAARCRRCREALEEAGDLPAALEGAQLMPAAHCRMLALGLRSGKADTVMEDIVQRMEEEAAHALEDAVSRIEPAMVLICSALVGAILLAVMLPLMNILSSLG